MSQNTPIVGKAERPLRDWTLWLGVLVLLVIVILLVVALANPELLAPTPQASVYLNPELRSFERYRLENAEAIRAYQLRQSPELGAFWRYRSAAGIDTEQLLRENPEIGLFQRWQSQH